MIDAISCCEHTDRIECPYSQVRSVRLLHDEDTRGDGKQVISCEDTKQLSRFIRLFEHMAFSLSANQDFVSNYLQAGLVWVCFPPKMIRTWSIQKRN